ncbi:MAG: hypothetical protein WDZ80_05565 [Candidatus Paceibacterota bacterium]
MHSYSIDTSERKYVPLILAILAVFCAWVFNVLFNYYHIELSWWISTPSVMGFYGLFWVIFDQWIWKLSILHTIGFIKTPILLGEWTGVIKSSFNKSVEKNVSVSIKQSWTRINIFLKTNTSHSNSLAASIALSDKKSPLLSYQYQNDPGLEAVDTMQIHYGTTNLLISDNLLSMSGNYYSGRGRQSIGAINLEKNDI